jgi:SAM-dependent methyltransferase
MPATESPEERLAREATFQDTRMANALVGKLEFRDRFYFINRQAIDAYVRLQQGLAGKKVVVVGSSDAGVTPLAREGVFVEGIDISSVSIQKLNDSIEHEGLGRFASARVMNAESLEYQAASIDVITCSGVLHHLDSERALQSWARCLKPNGYVALFEPLALHPVAAMFRLLTPSMRSADEHPLRERDFKLMKRFFARVERRDYSLLTPLVAGLAVTPGCRRLAERVLPAFELADRAILAALPFMGRLCWVSVVRLSGPIA